MDDLEYPACTRELFESEIVGERLFTALVAEARDDRDRYHFGTLLQLESETKARLRPLLFRHRVSLDESADFSLADLAVDAYRGMSWQEFMAVNVPVVAQFLDRFRAIAAAGDPGDRDVLESMVVHEASILRWATLESEGPSDSSLDDVIAQLHHPLPPG